MMLNKEINIPKFKVWHMIIVMLILALGAINYIQLALTTSLKSQKKELVKQNKSNDDKINALELDIKGYDLKIANQTSLISEFKTEKEKYIRNSNYYKKQYNEILNNYNTLNRAERFGATRELLHE